HGSASNAYHGCKSEWRGRRAILSFLTFLPQAQESVEEFGEPAAKPLGRDATPRLTQAVRPERPAISQGPHAFPLSVPAAVSLRRLWACSCPFRPANGARPLRRPLGPDACGHARCSAQVELRGLPAAPQRPPRNPLARSGVRR